GDGKFGGCWGSLPAARGRVRGFRPGVHEVGSLADAGAWGELREDAVARGVALRGAQDHERHQRRARGDAAQRHGPGGRARGGGPRQAPPPPHRPARDRHRADRRGRAHDGHPLRRAPQVGRGALRRALRGGQARARPAARAAARTPAGRLPGRSPGFL
ncbi:MAG: Transcriptional regulator, MarR family, partial [uncultured Rubrobacteraceae bacterium]